METKATVENLVVINSKDKGISIGENSDVIIKNSVLKNNKIGAAVKDSSNGKFYDVNFSNNEFNWQVMRKIGDMEMVAMFRYMTH